MNRRTISFNGIQVIVFSHVFTLCLDILEDAGFSFASLALVLAGHLTSLASNVRFYKPLSALLSKLVTTDSLLDILAELEEELVMLACHRFGHTVVVALLEAELPPATRERLVGKFQGRIAELACHPTCCAVVEVLLTISGEGQQAALIEEVCTVTTNQADMAVISLTKDKQGHAIVLTMLKVGMPQFNCNTLHIQYQLVQVSRHKQVHNLLKASILCKQDELVGNVWAARVLKTIKTEFHNRA